ncbi:MAG TPA: hypothetical protein VFZ77_24145, partial [Acidimicrobiales bacterium]
DLGTWLPLHLFLAGGLATVISGATVLFTVTWAAAPAPPRRVLALQRGCVAAGAAGVALARLTGAPSPVLAAAGVAFAAGLALLGAVLVVTVRRGVERRYDAAVAWYVAAVAAGIAAAGAGTALGTGRTWGDLRTAHVALNLLGLVGLVIGGTLPSFAATVGRTRMAPWATAARHRALLAWQVAALATAVAGSVARAPALAAAGLGAYAAGLLATAALLPRPGARKVVWAGPRLAGLWAGVAWWVAACAAAAVTVARDGTPLAGRWLLVLAVAGYGQILWASLAYLAPMLRGGGHERLSAGFATTRSWPGFAAANAAGVGLALGAGVIVPVAVAVWVLDAAWRAAALRREAA